MSHLKFPKRVENKLGLPFRSPSSTPEVVNVQSSNQDLQSQYEALCTQLEGGEVDVERLIEKIDIACLLGRFQEALKDLGTVESIDLSNLDCIILKTCIYYSLSQWPMCFAESSRGLQFDSQNTFLLRVRISTSQQLARWPQVIEDSSLLIEGGIWDGSVLYVIRGVAYGKVGKYEEVVRDCSSALERDPTSVSALHNRAMAYVNLTRWLEVVRDCENASALGYHPSSLQCVHAMALGQLGQNERVVGVSSSTIELDPSCLQAYIHRAVAYSKMGEFDKVVDDCTVALILDDRCVSAYQHRGFAHNALNDFYKADEDFSEVIKLTEARGGPQLAKAFASRAALYLAMRRWREAIDDSGRAMLHNPSQKEAFEKIKNAAKRGWEEENPMEAIQSSQAPPSVNIMKESRPKRKKKKKKKKLVKGEEKKTQNVEGGRRNQTNQSSSTQDRSPRESRHGQDHLPAFIYSSKDVTDSPDASKDSSPRSFEELNKKESEKEEEEDGDGLDDELVFEEDEYEEDDYEEDVLYVVGPHVPLSYESSDTATSRTPPPPSNDNTSLDEEDLSSDLFVKRSQSSNNNPLNEEEEEDQSIKSPSTISMSVPGWLKTIQSIFSTSPTLPSQSSSSSSENSTRILKKEESSDESSVTKTKKEMGRVSSTNSLHSIPSSNFIEVILSEDEEGNGGRSDGRFRDDSAVSYVSESEEERKTGFLQRMFGEEMVTMLSSLNDKKSPQPHHHPFGPTILEGEVSDFSSCNELHSSNEKEDETIPNIDLMLTEEEEVVNQEEQHEEEEVKLSLPPPIPIQMISTPNLEISSHMSWGKGVLTQQCMLDLIENGGRWL